MEIKKSEFVISAPTISKCPADTKSEYAFIGRSNVGKSSLINMLCNHKGLAKTSSKPGKTLLINHFIINNEWYLVDLPGYGYAKQSKATQKKLQQMISSYILQREQLINLFVLIDIRHPQQNVAAWMKELKDVWEELPPYFITSAEKKTGREEVLNYIDSINQSLNNNGE